MQRSAMSEIKWLFEEMIENLEWASYDMGETIGHLEDAAKIAYEIVMRCKAKGIEPQYVGVTVDPTWPEERKMCEWAALFMRLGEDLHKAETPCLMYLAYKLYRGVKKTDSSAIELFRQYAKK